MKPRQYCCCAIPLVYAGIYVTLTEQLLLGILVGVLALATPSIVGVSAPSVASWVLAVVCFVASGVQVLGFIAVAQERTILYRRYVSLHSILSLGAFAVAGAWIGISATRHSTAKSKCLADFFASAPGQGPDEGETLCEIFPWVDIGIMGGIWLTLAIMQSYLSFLLSSYGSAQRRDHDKYAQVSDVAEVDAIQMNTRDAWDSGLSVQQDRNYRHVRQESGHSISDVMDQPAQHANDTFEYNYQDQGTRNSEDGQSQPGSFPPGPSKIMGLSDKHPPPQGAGRGSSRADGY